MEIDAGAKRRLADEYDAAQERGEARKRGGNDKVTKLPDGKFGPKDIGLTHKQIHEARAVRDYVLSVGKFIEPRALGENPSVPSSPISNGV